MEQTDEEIEEEFRGELQRVLRPWKPYRWFHDTVFMVMLGIVTLEWTVVLTILAMRK